MSPEWAMANVNIAVSSAVMPFNLIAMSSAAS
jgi:hypothetical protein